jgi:hypothetical protein
MRSRPPAPSGIRIFSLFEQSLHIFNTLWPYDVTYQEFIEVWQRHTQFTKVVKRSSCFRKVAYIKLSWIPSPLPFIFPHLIIKSLISWSSEWRNMVLLKFRTQESSQVFRRFGTRVQTHRVRPNLWPCLHSATNYILIAQVHRWLFFTKRWRFNLMDKESSRCKVKLMQRKNLHAALIETNN